MSSAAAGAAPAVGAVGAAGSSTRGGGGECAACADGGKGFGATREAGLAGVAVDVFLPRPEVKDENTLDMPRLNFPFFFGGIVGLG